jgi:hypothetical protein
MTQDWTSTRGQRPEFESEETAEWRIRNGGVVVLRLDRKTGAWAGEWERLDPDAPDNREPHIIGPEVAQALAQDRDLRLRDGTKAVK